MNFTLYGNVSDDVLISQSMTNQSYFSFVRENCLKMSSNFGYVFIFYLVSCVTLYFLSHSKKVEDALGTVWFPVVEKAAITFVSLLGVFLSIAILYVLYAK